MNTRRQTEYPGGTLVVIVVAIALAMTLTGMGGCCVLELAKAAAPVGVRRQQQVNQILTEIDQN